MTEEEQIKAALDRIEKHLDTLREEIKQLPDKAKANNSK